MWGRFLASALLVLACLGGGAGARAETAEDQLGTWFIYNGTIRFSERWSLFTETHVRLWEPLSNLEETFIRLAPQYHFNPDAFAALGYMLGGTWPYDDGPRVGVENCIYEQLSLGQTWARSRLDHRYRLEQRWRRSDGGTRFSSRVRYRIQVTTPLNRDAMEPGAYFVNAYDEIFINVGESRSFDQNRLYGALGYQFGELNNLQLGLLWQARTSADIFRLQVFYTHNFDLRD